MPCALLNGNPWSRTSVSASSVSVVQPSAARASSRAASNSAVVIAAATSFTARFAADGAGVLERHRIALLRHDAAALNVAFTEPQVVELRRAPEQQILNE